VTPPPVDVSVISVFHNRRAYVVESVRSLLTQDCPDLEILLVDDGSTDGTAEWLGGIADDRVRFIGQPGIGFVSSLIDAVAASRGRRIAIHGAGDISLPGRLRRQAEALDQDAELGVVGCYLKNIDPASGREWLRVPAAPHSFREAVIRENPFCHGEVMFTRAAYEQAGGYRPFFQYAQDRDLWLRMSRFARHGIIPEVLYQRVTVPGSISKTPLTAALQACYSAFALDCDQAVAAGEGDLLERYGAAAPFFRRPSAALGRKLVDLAILAALDGAASDARACLALARREGAGVTASLCALALADPVPEALRRAVLHGLRQGLAGAPLDRLRRMVRRRAVMAAPLHTGTSL